MRFEDSIFQEFSLFVSAEAFAASHLRGRRRSHRGRRLPRRPAPAAGRGAAVGDAGAGHRRGRGLRGRRQRVGAPQVGLGREAGAQGEKGRGGKKWEEMEGEKWEEMGRMENNKENTYEEK